MIFRAEDYHQNNPPTNYINLIRACVECDIIPNSFFGNYNPYKDIIHGDWFKDMGRVHHTGEVYLNGKSLWELATLEGVLNLKQQKDIFDWHQLEQRLDNQKQH